MENSFKEAEKRERACLMWLKENKPNDYHHLAISDIGAYEAYDAIGYTNIQDKGFRMAYIEVKIRDFVDSTYPTAYLEKQKVDKLIELLKSDKALPSAELHYYAAYPKSKKIYVFDILSTPHTLVLDVPCPKTTMGNKETVLKDMLSYNLNDAIKVIDL